MDKTISLTIFVTLVANAYSAMFADCPPNFQCDCKRLTDSSGKQLRVIDCSNRQLFRLPNFQSVSNIRFDKLLLGENNFNSIPDNAFGRLRVKMVDFSNNTYLRTLAENALAGLQEVEEISFSGSALTELPTSLRHLKDLEVLNLHQNDIRNVDKFTFMQLKKLESLDLSYNPIPSQTIFSALTDLTRLEHLNLGSCNLMRLPDRPFYNMKYLKTLDLSSNRLTMLPEDVFDDKDDLEVLDMRNNPLSVHSQHAFRGMDDLKVLRLSFCNIPTLNPEFFNDLDNLEILEISNCRIQVAANGVFKDLDSLKELYIGGNLLPLSSGLFTGLEDTLETLDVSYLRLQRFPVAYLTKLQKLKAINADGNYITSLEARTFARLYGDHELYVTINNNKIRRVEPRTVQDLKRPITLSLKNNSLSNLDFLSHDTCSWYNTKLDVSGNPITCSCQTYGDVQKKIVQLIGTCSPGYRSRYAGIKLAPSPGEAANQYFLERAASRDCARVGDRTYQKYDCCNDNWIPLEQERSVCDRYNSANSIVFTMKTTLLSLLMTFILHQFR